MQKINQFTKLTTYKTLIMATIQFYLLCLLLEHQKLHCETTICYVLRDQWTLGELFPYPYLLASYTSKYNFLH